MPRPMKRRRICCMPEYAAFEPCSTRGSVSKRGARPCGEERIVMAIDEYETLRLIDLEGMTQLECAAQMEVARTTVQAIYEQARKKLADAIVNGKPLLIEGGHYRLSHEDDTPCGKGCRCPKKEGEHL